MWIDIIILSLAACALPIFRTKSKRKEILYDLLFQKWRLARDKRLLFKETHGETIYSYRKEEYEELWNIEIGAEALYLIWMDGRGATISYSECQIESDPLGNP